MRQPSLDTIVAPATPMGRGALAIVRIDGPRGAAILQSLAGCLPDDHIATRIDIRYNQELLDECIAIRFAAPRSFTGNDLIELTLHGSAVVVEGVVRAVVNLGARLAEPGEFTERAVLNGKIDLLQAESIADLIHARTSLQAKVSLANLEGAVSRRAGSIRQSLLQVISRLEAALDFSEEDYQFISRDDARRIVETSIGEAGALLESYRRGAATCGGLSAVIVGRPNAGKSTLLNRLVGSDRAIVTPVPGTTRDVVRETIEIGGLPVTLSDTAGLRESADPVEGIGVERARRAAETADVVLYLVDAQARMTEDDRRELGRWPEAWIVYTKTDLAPAPEGSMGISAATDQGIDALLGSLDRFVRDRYAALEGSLVNERQRGAVAECDEALRASLSSIDAGHEEQIVLVDLYRASAALGLLTGAITREEIFHEIFSKFCIGK